jgi:hypothetical protein
MAKGKAKGKKAVLRSVTPGRKAPDGNWIPDDYVS